MAATAKSATPPTVTKPQRLALKKRRTFIAYLFVVPAFAFLAVFFFVPLAQIVYYSFTDFNMFSGNWVGWNNYRELLSDSLFWKSLRKSFIYLLVTPILIIVSLALAIIVDRPLRGMKFFRAMYFIPAVISPVALGIIFELVYAHSGLLNGLLLQLGLINNPIAFLQNPALVLPSIMGVTVWRGIGYYMIFFLAGLQAIPTERYEAAAIDGANSLQQHWYITVPGVKPIILLVGVLSSIAALQAFDEIFIMTRGSGGVLNSGVTTMFYVYQQAFKFNEVGYASAVAVVFSLLIIALTLVNLRLGGNHEQ